jgi:hypothetical protein
MYILYPGYGITIPYPTHSFVEVGPLGRPVSSLTLRLFPGFLLATKDRGSHPVTPGRFPRQDGISVSFLIHLASSRALLHTAAASGNPRSPAKHSAEPPPPNPTRPPPSSTPRAGGQGAELRPPLGDQKNPRPRHLDRPGDGKNRLLHVVAW